MFCEEEFYENTTDPIIIYDQIPFEGGTLVLAEKIMDGENYPELHFVDDIYKVTYLTQGSYCWTLNYTQFKGHSIYFGLAGVETRQYQANLIPAEKVEALFSDKIVSVLTSEKVVEPINPLEKDSRKFDNPQGYIMPVEGRDIPEDFVFIFSNGEKKSISKMHIERSIDYMPDYLKSKKAEVYNSFAFTYTPMLTPIEWDQGYKEGEICLEGKTDLNGNRNALFLQRRAEFVQGAHHPWRALALVDRKRHITACSQNLGEYECSNQTSGTREPLVRQEVWCLLQGESPCWARSSQPPISSVAPKLVTAR